jgi:cell division protein FtsN
MKVELPGRGTWFRVRIGYFDSLEEAQNYQRENNL